MKTMNLLKIAASSLILGAGVGAVAVAKQQSTSAVSANAGKDARKASALLAKGKFDKAIAFGERAVAGMPGNAGFRAILGQAYLAAGRFQSAEAMLRDAAMLDPSNSKVALNLVLAQVALGKNSVALGTLENAKAGLAASDYGLALALAGDLDAARQVLENAARGVDADAKARQNLALTYAMSGRWAEARVMAMQDLAPDLVSQRLGEWAMFARPNASWDQVASLLGVTPAYDPGMPVQLAFNAAPAPAVAPTPDAEPAPVRLAVAEPAPAPAPVAVTPEVTPVPVGMVSAAPDAVFELPSDAFVAKPAFVAAPAIEPVKPAPEPVLIMADASPVKQAVVRTADVAAVPKIVPAALIKASAAAESGRYAVQLGAFSSEGRAQLAWKGAVSKVRDLSNHSAGTSRVTVRGTEFYRLAVSGFTSLEAASQVCARVKASGGQCFIRAVGQGNPMQWAKKRTPVRQAKKAGPAQVAKKPVPVQVARQSVPVRVASR